MSQRQYCYSSYPCNCACLPSPPLPSPPLPSLPSPPLPSPSLPSPPLPPQHLAMENMYVCCECDAATVSDKSLSCCLQAKSLPQHVHLSFLSAQVNVVNALIHAKFSRCLVQCPLAIDVHYWPVRAHRHTATHGVFSRPELGMCGFRRTEHESHVMLTTKPQVHNE